MDEELPSSSGDDELIVVELLDVDGVVVVDVDGDVVVEVDEDEEPMGQNTIGLIKIEN